ARRLSTRRTAAFAAGAAHAARMVRLVQSIIGTRLNCSVVRCHLVNAYVPHDTRSSAVRSILKLNEQAVGVREVEFRGPFFCTSTILHSHADVVHQGSRRSLCTSSWLDAVAFERLDDLF